jgi:hypothetical protein
MLIKIFSMKNTIGKRKKKDNKGYITFVILIIAILGFILAGGLASFTKSPITADYLLITPTPGIAQSKSSLQLKTLQYEEITFTPTPPKPLDNPVTQVSCTTTPPSDIPTLVATLEGSFGIYPQGAITLYRLQSMFQTLCLLWKSTRFASLLNSRNAKITIQIGDVSPKGGSCAGKSHPWGVIELYGNCSHNLYAYEFILSHEFGHQIEFRNNGLYNKFLNTVPWFTLPLPTYDCLLDYGTGPFNDECWADMIGEYLVWRNYRQISNGRPSGPRALLDFTTTYKPYYDFAKQYIFGNVDY